MKTVAGKLSQSRASLSLTSAPVRCFGAAPSDPNHMYKMHKMDSKSTTFKIPSETDMKYQLPQKGILNEKIQMWIAARWAVDRDEILDNTKVNKYSAYYHFMTNPL